MDMKSPYGMTKNETDFILSENPGIGHDVEVLRKIQCSDHKMVRRRVRVNLKTVRRKFVKHKKSSIKSVRDRTQEFKITLQNKFAL